MNHFNSEDEEPGVDPAAYFKLVNPETGAVIKTIPLEGTLNTSVWGLYSKAMVVSEDGSTLVRGAWGTVRRITDYSIDHLSNGTTFSSIFNDSLTAAPAGTFPDGTWYIGNSIATVGSIDKGTAKVLLDRGNRVYILENSPTDIGLFTLKTSFLVEDSQTAEELSSCPIGGIFATSDLSSVYVFKSGVGLLKFDRDGTGAYAMDANYATSSGEGWGSALVVDEGRAFSVMGGWSPQAWSWGTDTTHTDHFNMKLYDLNAVTQVYGGGFSFAKEVAAGFPRDSASAFAYDPYNGYIFGISNLGLYRIDGSVGGATSASSWQLFN